VIARALVLLVLWSSACRQPPPPPPVVTVPTPELPPEPRWPGTLVAVRAAIDSGRFAAADSILEEFERNEPGTRDALESEFWRLLIRTDPRNPAFSPDTARAALEAYVASPDASRRTEATALLRLLVISDSLRTAQASARAAAEQRDRARDEEIERLREELQKTQAELERIKRRIGSPRP
jgi:hypothetical protein